MSSAQEQARAFLDLEAIEDGTEDEQEEDGNDFDDFFDDTDNHRSTGHDATTRSYRATAPHNDGLENLLDGILHRATHSSRPPPLTPLYTDTTTDFDERLSRLPTEDDHPLWKVKCRLGIEEEAVFFLGHAALSSRDNINVRWRSCFVCEGQRGWIFVEGIMNQGLEDLLMTAPGIVQTLNGIHKEQVDFSDWVALLEMRKASNTPDAGEWVRVTRGTYRGDVGLVSESKEWGAFVLLVPRFRRNAQRSSGKRKRGSQTPSERALFDYSQVNLEHNPTNLPHLRPKTMGENVFSFHGIEYHHGLVTRKYSFASLSSRIEPITLPTSDTNPFIRSGHPFVLARRHQLQWVIFIGEPVSILTPTPKRGIVTSVSLEGIEIDLSSGEGIKSFPWSLVKKIIQPGDYVEVIGGPAKGKTGWVIGVANSTAQIAEIGANDSTKSAIESFGRHVNSLRVIDPPHQHAVPNLASPADTIDEAPIAKKPWLKTEVIVIKGGDFKGELGIVEDVLTDQSTPSGLKVAIRLKNTSRYNPASPFIFSKQYTLDYDWVVEARTLFELSTFQPPNDEVFRPRPRPHGHKRPSTPEPIHKDKTVAQTTATGTPLWNPDDVDRFVPAWDPSSRTPLTPLSSDALGHSLGSPSRTSAFLDVWGPVGGSLVSTGVPNNGPVATVAYGHTPLPITSHDLLDPRLHGIEVKVHVTHGKDAGKDVAGVAARLDGETVFHRVHYSKTISYQLQNIELKRPHPTRDNGPLVVSKGEHTGKRVRRIHHRYDQNGHAIMRLVVVQQPAMGVGLDILGTEEIELEAADVCVGNKTKDQRKHLDGLLSHAREAARKIRAK